MDEGNRTEVGTTITLFLNEDCLKFCNEYEARSIIEKYCSFMPTEIYLIKANNTDTETINEDEKTESDEVVETIKPEKDGDPVKLKIKKRPQLMNDTNPLWTRHPNDCTKEDYLAFYRKVFLDYKEPLFWIHLNMDYPFNLKGILYFPKINTEYDSIEGTIKLYNNQVFIADNIKEVIPEFLMLLKGVIDCPDLPLNVSRSALQNDGFVKKISDYITKKVADKLSGMCKTEKEEYEKYWDDIAPFVKYGCLKDDKFCEKITDYILFKNLDGKYLTLPECLEVKKIDPDEVASSDASEDATGATTGDTPDVVDASATDAELDAADADSDDATDSDKKDKVIYYVTDEVQQGQYIQMFKQAKMDAVILTHNIDQPFVSQLESKNEGIKFQRIDADLTEDFKAKTNKKTEEELKAMTEKVEKIFKKAIKKEGLKVVVNKLKNKKIASMITLSEDSRRMQDMMKMYGMMGMPGMGPGKDGETLVLNSAHPLVEYVLGHEDADNTKLICEQLYDLAMLQHAPLNPEDMAKFIARSNDIMMIVAKN